MPSLEFKGPGGLMYVLGRANNPSQTPDSLVNKFYNEEHLPDLMSHNIQGNSRFAVRYQNIDPTTPFPFLTLFPVDDASILVSPTMGRIIRDTSTSKVLGGNVLDHLTFDCWAVEKVGSSNKMGSGETLVCVVVDGEGEEQDEEMGGEEGYVKYTRWKRFDGVRQTVTLYEYECAPEEVPKIAERRRVVQGVDGGQRSIWRLIHAAGDERGQL